MTNLKSKINIKKYYKNYKNIQKACLNVGYAPPQYFGDLDLDLPLSDDFTDDEREVLMDKIPEKSKIKLEETYKNRRKEDIKIIHIENEIERNKYIENLYERELQDFFKKFPQFKIILED